MAQGPRSQADLFLFAGERFARHVNGLPRRDTESAGCSIRFESETAQKNLACYIQDL